MTTTFSPTTMIDSEAVLRSQEFLNAVKTLARVLQWGTVIIEAKDSKIVMARIQKDVKLS
jgi:hypothetical protein